MHYLIEFLGLFNKWKVFYIFFYFFIMNEKSTWLQQQGYPQKTTKRTKNSKNMTI